MIRYEGPGWRLERDNSRKNFSVLIGGENCAFELSENEWHFLGSIVSKLIDEYEKVKNQLMVEEAISLEMEIPPWWASLDGDLDGWNLKLILSGEEADGRGLEIFWPEPVAKEIAFKIRLMWDCNWEISI